MKEQDDKAISRRTFMGAATSTAFAFSIVPGKVLGKEATFIYALTVYNIREYSDEK